MREVLRYNLHGLVTMDINTDFGEVELTFFDRNKIVFDALTFEQMTQHYQNYRELRKHEHFEAKG